MTVRLLGERYELRSVLGRGGMAEVWQAFDRRLGRLVAVKVLHQAGLTDPSMLARFDREARTVARLSHPNIVAVHDVGVDGGVSYLVMELVQGRSLAELLAGGPLDPRRAVRIAVQVCDALGAAHAAGVVHRDVKPANILLTDAGQVKVCDFGIARIANAAQPNLTAPAMAIGTSAYMAPEQISGGPVDARTDLYALGCVLFAMLTGHPPFHGDTPMQIVYQHLHQPAPPVATRLPELGALVGALLAKDPADRPASAGHVRAVLEQLDAGPEPTAAMPVLPAERPIRATAAVSAPTQAMPTVGGPDEPAAARHGFRLGPAGVVLVAIAAAAVAVVVFAVILAGRSGGPDEHATSPTTGAAAPSTSSTVSASAAQPSEAPADALAAVREAVAAQAGAGALDRGAVRDLTKQLDQIARDISRDDRDRAAERVADLRKRLGELRDNGKLTAAGYDAIMASVDRLAASLPQPGVDGD